MLTFIKTWTAFKSDKRAVTALEYGLIAAVVVAVGLAGFSSIGTSLQAKMTSVNTALTTP